MTHTPELLDACKELRDALDAAMRSMDTSSRNRWFDELESIGISEGFGKRADEAIAKASLIAAAPELLAAIKRLRYDGINDETVMLAEAAIEKAEGRQ